MSTKPEVTSSVEHAPDTTKHEITHYLDDTPRRKRLFWGFYILMSAFWLLQGVMTLTSEAVEWKRAYAYFQVVVGAVFLAASVYFLRYTRDRMRWAFGDEKLEIKTTETSDLIEIDWHDITKVTITANQVEFRSADKSTRVPMTGTYAANQEIKQTISDFCERRGIETEGV